MHLNLLRMFWFVAEICIKFDLAFILNQSYYFDLVGILLFYKVPIHIYVHISRNKYSSYFSVKSTCTDKSGCISELWHAHQIKDYLNEKLQSWRTATLNMGECKFQRIKVSIINVHYAQSLRPCIYITCCAFSTRNYILINRRIMFKHTLINYGDIKNSSDMTFTKRRWAVRIFSF